MYSNHSKHWGHDGEQTDIVSGTLDPEKLDEPIIRGCG